MKGAIIIILLLSLSACQDKEEMARRNQWLQEEHEMLAPEITSLVQTVTELDEKIRALEITLKGEEGEVNQGLKQLNSSLDETRQSLHLLHAELEASREQLSEIKIEIRKD